MKYLVVTNWDTYQHYKNRRAPWIKAYTDPVELPLEHPKFTNLTDGAKLTLHHVRLLAGVTGNAIPENQVTRDRLNMKTPHRVQELVDAGFVEWKDASELARQPDSNKGDQSLAKSDKQTSRARARAGSPPSPVSREELLFRTKDEKHASRAGARAMVESFVVSEKQREWAATNTPGVDVDAATESMRDHFRSTEYRTRTGPLADVDAAWRNWMRRELKFLKERHGNRKPDNEKRRAPVSFAGAD